MTSRKNTPDYLRFVLAMTLVSVVTWIAAMSLGRRVEATSDQLQATAEKPQAAAERVRATPVADAEYLSPSEMAFSADGLLLYVLCERKGELIAVDLSTGNTLRHVSVGQVPRGLALSPDGRQVYVANSWDDTVSVIDAASFEVTRRFTTGAEPISIVTDRNGSSLYVANRIGGDISVIDTTTGLERKRLTAARGASYLAISADGARIYCTHIYPLPGAFRTPPESEITVIDTASQTVVERLPVHNVAGEFHVATSNDGRLGVVAQMRPKNLVPLAHVEHGWVVGNSLTLFGADVGAPVQVPIDELDRYYSLPYGVAISRYKSRIYVSTATSDSVTVIDTNRLLAFVHAHRSSFVDDLAASSNYVIARIDVGRNPRGVLLSPDGKRLLVANRLDDTISIIDTHTNAVASTLDLGGPRKTDAWRRGEQLFFTAKYAFQGQFACANCHIDSTFDALTWDLEPDGFGKDIVDNRLLEDIRDTEPFKWNGGNPDLPTECGPRTEKYFFRSQGFSDLQLADLALYIRSLPLRPNRYRLPHGELTAAQQRGKAIFIRIRDKRGNAIPQQKQCAFCHSGKKYTNQKQFDVGTSKQTDRSPIIDTPQLTNVVLTAPYLHDGSARTLEEIWTVFNPHDTHGVTSDLTKDELNDLIAYLRAL